MNFLFPAFLFASAAVAIPVIIHLFNFRRYKKVFFPSIQFLKEVKEQTTHQNKLKHLLIMACRILAVLFAVLAFAQPFIKNNFTTVNKDKQIVSIYLDNSFSMNATKNGVPLIELAKHKADEVIQGYGAATQFQIITNEMTGSEQHLIGKDEALKIVDEIKITPASPFLNEIIAKQKQAISFSGNKNAQCYLISDFQKSELNASAIKSDSDYNAFAAVLSADEQTNLSIDSCWFETPVQTINQQVKLLVKISNYCNHAVNSNRLTLTINNQLKFLGDFNVEANSKKVDTIPFTATHEGWNECVLNINDNPITFDDNYYFSFEVLNKINVLCINGEKENQFLKALFSNDAQINCSNQSASQIDFNHFNQQQCIVLNSLQNVSSGLGSELQKFVKNGGSLIIFPNENMDVNNYNTLLSVLHAGNYGTLINKEQSVTAINHQAEVFKNVFVKLTDNMELPKVKKYFPISSSILMVHEPLLTMKDGNDLMSKFQFEKGNVYVCAVPLNKDYSDFPLKAVFVPMLLKMSFSGIHLNEMSYTIGKNNHIEIPTSTNKTEPTYTLKSKTQEFIPEQMNVENNLYLHVRNEIHQAGIFELTGTADSLKPAIAFNFNRNESDLSFYKTNELEEKLAPLNIHVLDIANKNLTAVVGEINQGIVLWKVCLQLALLFIAIEVLLLRFWKV